MGCLQKLLKNQDAWHCQRGNAMSVQSLRLQTDWWWLRPVRGSGSGNVFHQQTAHGTQNDKLRHLSQEHLHFTTKSIIAHLRLPRTYGLCLLQRCLSCLPHCEEERHVDRVSPGSVKDTWIERHGERVRLERRAHSSAFERRTRNQGPVVSRYIESTQEALEVSEVVPTLPNLWCCRWRMSAQRGCDISETRIQVHKVWHTVQYNPYQSLAHFSSISLSVQNQGLSSSLFSFQNFIVHMQSREESKASQSSQHHPSTPPRWLSWHLKRLSM